MRSLHHNPQNHPQIEQKVTKVVNYSFHLELHVRIREDSRSWSGFAWGFQLEISKTIV